MAALTHHTRGHSSTASEGPEYSIGHLPAHWQPSPIRPKLPVGVAVVAVLVAITGVLVILGGILYLLSTFLGPVVPSSLSFLSSLSPLVAAILIVVGASFVSVATALWDQETWALWTMVVLLFGLLAYLFFTDFLTILFLVLLVVFVYLLAVRRYFF